MSVAVTSVNQTKTVDLLRKPQPLALHNLQVWSWRYQKPEETSELASTSIMLLTSTHQRLTIEIPLIAPTGQHPAHPPAINVSPQDQSSEMNFPAMPSLPQHLNSPLSSSKSQRRTSCRERCFLVQYCNFEVSSLLSCNAIFDWRKEERSEQITACYYPHDERQPISTWGYSQFAWATEEHTWNWGACLLQSLCCVCDKTLLKEKKNNNQIIKGNRLSKGNSSAKWV